MASMAGARGTKTKLVIGAVACDVILHGTVAEPPKLKDYATAGPNGRPLRLVKRAVEAAPDETPVGEAVPVAKARPLAAGVPEKVREAADEMMARLGRAEPVREPVPPVATPTVDLGPGESRQVLVEEPGEGESIDSMPEVTKDMIRRGIRLADGAFIDLTASLADIETRTALDTMEVVATIDIAQVPRDRVMGSYYVAFEKVKGGDGAPGTLRVLYEAMRRVRRAPVVKYSARSRQSLGVLVADGRQHTLKLLKVAWAEDVREPGERQLAHLQAQVYEEEVRAMADLLYAYSETKADGLDSLRDDARELREELEAAALAGKADEFEVFAPVPESGQPDLMAALLRSLEAVRS